MPSLSTTSGTFDFNPEFSDWVIESFERIGIGPAALDDPKYIISARRSANLILLDLSGNRGANLAAIGDETLNVPLVQGKADYLLPRNVITLLDAYLREFTPDLENWRTDGFTLTPVLAAGQPVLTTYGEPAVAGTGSGVFSTTENSQYATMYWQAHGLMPGDPVFFYFPVTCGPVTLKNFIIVSDVIDSSTFKFLLPYPAPVTRTGVGGTALFSTRAGLDFITVTLPSHGYVIGDAFPIPLQMTVGGVVLYGLYTVNSVVDPHNFTISTMPGAPLTAPYWLVGTSGYGLGGPGVLSPGPSGPVAMTTEVAFENYGQLLVTSQAPGVQFRDLMMWPLSRNDYSVLPNKESQGRPAVYWFDRAPENKMRIFIWSTPQAGNLWGFHVYRMRYFEDAEMPNGVDMPRRMLPAFTAQLTAALAEKFSPQMFQEKLQLAEILWERAANADRELVNSYIIPQLQSYFR